MTQVGNSTDEVRTANSQMTPYVASRPITLAPSILTADLGRLAEQIAEAEDAGADRLHLDVMDGHFVPNITFGPLLVAAARKTSRLPFDVHLMIECPENYVEAFHEAGADRIIVHVEATPHLNRLVEQIKSLGTDAGVAINPATPIIDLEEIAPFLDMALVMSVNPGFGGQSFIETSPRKIYRTRRLIDKWNPAASIGVDGGVDAERVASVVSAGADCLVSGSAIYNDIASVRANLRRLRGVAEQSATAAPSERSKDGA